jgi:hypothetical protein
MTSTEQQSLDLERLEKVRHLTGKITARCPACAEEDHDRTGNHLVIFDDGKFSCIADDGHTRRIWELVGIRRELAPAEQERNRQEFIRRKREEENLRRRQLAARDALPELFKRWAWNPDDIKADSPLEPWEGDCPRAFLLSRFRPNQIVWTGQVKDSGEHHADRWKTVWQWLHEPAANIGPMVTPSTWKPGTVSRKRENVVSAPYLILDFDGPKGWTPRDQADLDRHIAESLAIVRWLKEDRRWTLAAIVDTGNKSLHAWFDHPGDALVKGLRESLDLIGIDPSLIGHPEHPARLPGQVHNKSGRTSRVLWLGWHGNR